jgi:hypothetical protein
MAASPGFRSFCTWLFAAVWTGRGALVTDSVAPTPYIENLETFVYKKMRCEGCDMSEP